MSDAADDDPEFAYLTTTGRRTGEPHTVELWYRRLDDGTVWFLAGDPSSDWILNATADPAVRVRIGDGPALPGTATVGEPAAAARRALAARYQGWREGAPLSSWAATATPLAVRGLGREGLGTVAECG